MFIWLPEWFKVEHPDYARNLAANKNRLTSPYDIHMTLKHILELSGRVEGPTAPLNDCPKCQSLFREIPWNRSCKDAGILPHWCVCSGYKVADKTEPAVQKMSMFILDHINNGIEERLRTLNNTSAVCANLTMNSIFDAMKSDSSKFIDYLIMFDVLPSQGIFEATVRSFQNNQEKFELVGSVSRINLYEHQGDCVNDSELRKYCFCQNEGESINT